MALLVEVKGVGGRQHVAHVQREVMRPRTEEDDRKAEEAVANDCYCPQSLLLHTEDKVVGCDCKDPEYLLAAREDREYRGDGSCGNPFRRLADLDTDFPDICQYIVNAFQVRQRCCQWKRRRWTRNGLDSGIRDSTLTGSANRAMEALN